MVDIIGKDKCAPGADKILNGTYDPPTENVSSLQIAYFKNFQWKKKHKPKCAQTLTSVNQIKQGFSLR